MLAGSHAKRIFDQFKCGWHVALSRNKITLRFCFFNLLLNVCNQPSIMLPVIHALLLACQIMGNFVGSTFLKHLGFWALPITRGFSNSPSMLAHKITVKRSLESLPPLHSSLFTDSVLLGNAQKNKPDSSPL